MNVRRMLLAVAVASSLGSPVAAHAANFSVDIDVAPPPPVYEQLPPREGYIVTPGYYRFDADSHKHVWVKGDYERERRGEHYVAPEWRQESGRYHFNEGHWDRDK
jgi:WXXGXW repeat (2 copies)